jgi:biotin carboxyl carrier protein
MSQTDELRTLVIGGVTYETRTTRKFQNRRTYVPPDPRRILCVIPGVIQKIYVQDGSVVKKDDRLLVLEAMKMQNDILSHRDARVAKVLVAVGDVVTKGQVLLELG